MTTTILKKLLEPKWAVGRYFLYLVLAHRFWLNIIKSPNSQGVNELWAASSIFLLQIAVLLATGSFIGWMANLFLLCRTFGLAIIVWCLSFAIFLFLPDDMNRQFSEGIGFEFLGLIMQLMVGLLLVAGSQVAIVRGKD